MQRLEFIQEGSSTPCQWGEGLNLIPPLTREMLERRWSTDTAHHFHLGSRTGCLEWGGRGMPFTIFKKYLLRVHWVFVAA